jgi:hypothetical protein
LSGMGVRPTIMETSRGKQKVRRCDNAGYGFVRWEDKITKAHLPLFIAHHVSPRQSVQPQAPACCIWCSSQQQG